MIRVQALNPCTLNRGWGAKDPQGQLRWCRGPAARLEPLVLRPSTPHVCPCRRDAADGDARKAAGSAVGAVHSHQDWQPTPHPGFSCQHACGGAWGKPKKPPNKTTQSLLHGKRQNRKATKHNKTKRRARLVVWFSEYYGLSAAVKVPVLPLAIRHTAPAASLPPVSACLHAAWHGEAAALDSPSLHTCGDVATRDRDSNQLHDNAVAHWL